MWALASAGERSDKRVDLDLEKSGRAVVPHDPIGEFDFPRQRQLLGDALSSEFPREAALLQSDKLQFRRTGYAHRAIKPIFQRLLEEQRHLKDPICFGLRSQQPPPFRK